MTFIERMESLSGRFLSDRSHELIVAPAIADLQHEADTGTRLSEARARASVLAAFGGAFYDELTADSGALRLVGLTLIPGFYYSFLILLCLPQAAEFVGNNLGRLLAIPAAMALLSIGPVLACCWPERVQRRSSLRPCSGQAADA